MKTHNIYTKAVLDVWAIFNIRESRELVDFGLSFDQRSNKNMTEEEKVE